MANVSDVVGLLHRADWTRLSLAAEVNTGIDPGLSWKSTQAARPPWQAAMPSWLHRDTPEPEGLDGFRSRRRKLLIAPGRRYREEDEDSGWISGCDGERRWDQGGPGEPGAADPEEMSGDPVAPLPALLRPAPLLTGFVLDVRGPVTACGRDAVHVVATPRPSMHDLTGRRHLGLDRIEAIVDTELGILLSREEFFEDQIVRLSQLTSLTLNPPEAADESQFRAPPGSVIRQSTKEKQREFYDQPVWKAYDLAACGLGAWEKHSPFRPGDTTAGFDPEPDMPPDEPGPADPSPVSDELLYLLYRNGSQTPELTATLHQWQDRAAVMSRVISEVAPGMGEGGFGRLLDATSEREPRSHTMATVRTGSHGRYRIDYAVHPRERQAKAIAGDGQRHWSLTQDRLVIGPAASPPGQLATMADASWLLECNLSGGAEVMAGNRRGYRISITGSVSPLRFLVFFPAEAVVDAELGVLLRLTCYVDGRPATRTELRDVIPGPVEPGVFRLDAPPGVRVVEESGNLLADMVAEAPGPLGAALRTTADAAKRTGEAVTAVRSFLDGLRRQ
jgi:hypothetical protein